MAKIKELPALKIINGMKGKIDYYLWMGIPCARTWPRTPAKPRAPSVRAQWAAFTAAAQLWGQLSLPIREAYQHTAASTNMTARDVFTKSYINGRDLYLLA